MYRYRKSSKFFIVIQLLSCVRLCDTMGCSMPGFLVLHYLLEFAQTHVHWVNYAIQPSHPLSPPPPSAFNAHPHVLASKVSSTFYQNNTASSLESFFSFTTFRKNTRSSLAWCPQLVLGKLSGLALILSWSNRTEVINCCWVSTT